MTTRFVLVFVSIIFFIVGSEAFLWDKFNIDRLFYNSENIFNELRQKVTSPGDQQCLAQFEFFVKELQNERGWAIKVLDSWGKMPSGIISGNYVDLGHFDQCFTSGTTQNSQIGTIESHYCQITIQETGSRRKTSFTMAVCSPSTCSPDLTGMIMEQFLKNVNYTLVKDMSPICSDGKPESFGAVQWVTIILIGIFALMLVVSTAYDVSARKKGVEPNRLYTSFSVPLNLNRLLKIQPNRRGGQFFDCLDGVRVLMIGWVVLLHAYEYPWFMPAVYNRYWPLDFKKTWGYCFMRHGDVAVETFFVVTGLLISYNFMKAREKGEPFNIIKYYIHRFFRIAPPYYFSVLFVVAFVQFAGNGPSYSVTEEWLRGNCVNYWWSALIFIQNWIPSSVMVCNAPTWYVSADMQFFLVSPFFLYLLVKFKKQCLYIFGAIALAASISVYTLIHVNGFNWVNHMGDKFFDYDPLIFHQSQHRIGPWLVGLLLGYYMFVTKDQRLSLSKGAVVGCWVLAIAAKIFVIWSPWYFYATESDEIQFFAFHQAIHRTLWASASAWVILACVKGHGGALNWLLSLQIWQPLSKLTYCIYLIHNPILMMTKLMQRTPDYISLYQTFHYFLSLYMFSLLAAIPWTITFEMPFIQAESELWKLKDKKREVKN